MLVKNVQIFSMSCLVVAKIAWYEHVELEKFRKTRDCSRSIVSIYRQPLTRAIRIEQHSFYLMRLI